MDSISQQLFDSLVGAFPEYATAAGRAGGLDDVTLGEAVRAGEEMLDQGLSGLLSTPIALQQETPVQVFRAALVPLRTALGEDPDSPSPASAAEISEQALEASLAWGASKAATMSRPVMAVVTANLMDLGPFEAAAARTGYRAERFDGADAVDARPVVAFVDLELDGADDTVGRLAEAGVRTIAYGPHVDSFALTRARTLGAAAAEPRSRVLRDPSAFLSPVV